MTNNNVTPRYFGEWHINIQTDQTNPGINRELQDLLFNTGLTNDKDTKYEPLAYLGNQSLGSNIHSENNHAILAKQCNQTDEIERIVIIIVYGDKQVISIERILESYSHRKEYDIDIDPHTDFPTDATKDYEIIEPLFNNILVEPLIYLGRQKCLNGINNLFAAEVTSLDPVVKKDVALVTINAVNKSYEINNILF